jgi:hypothetical protein
VERLPAFAALGFHVSWVTTCCSICSAGVGVLIWVVNCGFEGCTSQSVAGQAIAFMQLSSWAC